MWPRIKIWIRHEREVCGIILLSIHKHPPFFQICIFMCICTRHSHIGSTVEVCQFQSFSFQLFCNTVYRQYLFWWLTIDISIPSSEVTQRITVTWAIAHGQPAKLWTEPEHIGALNYRLIFPMVAKTKTELEDFAEFIELEF